MEGREEGEGEERVRRGVRRGEGEERGGWGGGVSSWSVQEWCAGYLPLGLLT